MAKKKRSQQTPEKTEPKSDSATVDKESHAAPARQKGVNERMALRDYVLMNVYFDVFCLVQLILVRLFLRETRGMYFFFGMLMIGFLLVSIFDYLYEKAYAKEKNVPSASS